MTDDPIEGFMEIPIVTATIDVIHRSGSRTIQIRYSDDEEPIIWAATAMHYIGPDRIPVAEGGERHWTVGAGLTPQAALISLAEKLLDGGICVHCNRVSGLDDNPTGASPLDAVVCFYRYDPELQTYRRSCEGVT